MKKLGEVFNVQGDDKLLCESLSNVIDVVKDFPINGINFVDITSLMKDSYAFKSVVKALAWQVSDFNADCIVCVEARGFLFGAAVAYEAGLPLVIARKKGKLPKATICASYQKEYGFDEIYMQADDLPLNARVVIVDDIIATGNTVDALAELIERKFDAERVHIMAVAELTSVISADIDRTTLVQLEDK